MAFSPTTDAAFAGLFVACVTATIQIIQAAQRRARVFLACTPGINPNILPHPQIVQIMATNESARPITIIAIGYDGLGMGHYGLLPMLLTPPNGYCQPPLPAYLVEGQVLNAWFPDYLAGFDIPDLYMTLWVQDSHGRRHYVGRGLKRSWRRRNFLRMPPGPVTPLPPPSP